MQFDLLRSNPRDGRGSSSFFVTPKAGGKVDLNQLTQLGRALKELGIQMIPTCALS
jgi:hypothetical protein